MAALSETLLPTSWSVKDPTVNSPGAAADGTSGTFALLREPTVQQAAIVDYRFPVSTIPPLIRTRLALRVTGRWRAAGDLDEIEFGISVDNGASFQLVQGWLHGTGFPDNPSAPTARTLELTVPAAGVPVTEIVLRCQFGNGDPAFGGLPAPVFDTAA